MKTWKHKILPTVLAGTLTLTFGTAVSAKENNNGHGHGHGQGNGNGNDHKANGKGNSYPVKVEDFSDLKKHWAEATVKIMMDKSIINGYPDHTFRPNKPVTQLEALTMVINLLTQNKDLLTVGDDYTGKDVPDWAQNSVKLALINHIVDDKDFQPNKPATRMFVIKLLVNALGSEFDENSDDNLYFGDISKLSSDEKAYLSFALLQSLVEGYGDKTFKPNKPVTRAEMAVFVNRLLGKIGNIDLGSNVKGTIAKIDKEDEELTIGSKTYEVADDVVVKLDGKSSSFDSLDVGMKIELVLKNNKIQTIYAYTTDEEVAFKVEKISDGKLGGSFQEAVKTGSRISNSTPDLSNETLSISLNGKAFKSIDLEDIDGSEDDGDEVAAELEAVIGDALDDNSRVNVSYEGDKDRFVFETDNSPTDVVPSIKFTGSALDKLGLDTSVDKGSLKNSSVAESWKITVKSNATFDSTYAVKVKDDHINETVTVKVEDNDTAKEIAKKIVDALQENEEIDSAYDLNVKDQVITLTAKDSGEDLDVEIGITKK
ncbi:S-layer homology domain-containing protein [Brevibacillus fluminis]|uniref:S-layer homology domain-containing protein n=1 Tax=Brevibacillus fluminis TaxID=511487 RepID=A0A3M8D9R6_9BACL|nr:S-layer homology domain-containing protein [Brevibacillus fluminis]RNB84643.1 S-layer homology domain-containing protein [Brevibacillus fluminis]